MTRQQFHDLLLQFLADRLGAMPDVTIKLHTDRGYWWVVIWAGLEPVWSVCCMDQNEVLDTLEREALDVGNKIRRLLPVMGLLWVLR